MLLDLKLLSEDLKVDTRNVLLRFSRIWAAIETNEMMSTSSAANWVIKHLPNYFKPLIIKAKLIYLGKEEECWKEEQSLIEPLSCFRVEKIKNRISNLQYESSRCEIKLFKESNLNFHKHITKPK